MALTKSLSFSLRRKRVLLISSNCCNLKQFCGDFQCFTPMKKSKIDIENSISSVNNLLEDLPQELLIKVICGVYHDDLKQLFFVSKTVRDAAVIAKKCHFAYSTPLKTKAFRNSIDTLNNNNNLGNSIEYFEPPSAPKPVRRMTRRRIDRKTINKIAITLFSDEAVVAAEPKWTRRSLFLDINS